MKYSVCVDALFWGKDPYEAIELIHSCGIDAVEFWGWQDKDLDKLKTLTQKLGMEISAICTDPVSLADPSMREAYAVSLNETIEAAKKIGSKGIITQVGNDNGLRFDFMHDSIVAGLKAVAPALEEAGITLFMEPLNTRVDHAGYYLNDSDEAFMIVEEVGSPNVKVLFDIYHQQIMEGDVTRRILANLELIGHFHAAGNPGRHEIDNGELNYDYILKQIDAAGYTGFVGLEYFPEQEAEIGLRKISGK